MTQKDLMIGDWVLDGNHIAQIVLVTCDGIIGTTFNESSNIDVIEPIPFTPEILEKNGFSDKYAEDDWSYATDYSGDVIAVHICGNGGIMDEMYFNYVHELQHAMRLCGIEKEIEL